MDSSQFGMLIEYLFDEFPNWEEIGEQAIGDLQVVLSMCWLLVILRATLSVHLDCYYLFESFMNLLNVVSPMQGVVSKTW